jgi:hypothetical protein
MGVAWLVEIAGGLHLAKQKIFEGLTGGKGN